MGSSTSLNDSLETDVEMSVETQRKKIVENILRKLRIVPYLTDLCVSRYIEIHPTATRCIYKRRQARYEYTNFIFNNGTTKSPYDCSKNYTADEYNSYIDRKL